VASGEPILLVALAGLEGFDLAIGGEGDEERSQVR
jgi:hypothetical protein